MTKAERKARWDICMKYLRTRGNLPDAMRAAKRDGISYDTSVWITALGKLLQAGEVPGGVQK